MQRFYTAIKPGEGPIYFNGTSYIRDSRGGHNASISQGDYYGQIPDPISYRRYRDSNTINSPERMEPYSPPPSSAHRLTDLNSNESVYAFYEALESVDDVKNLFVVQEEEKAEEKIQRERAKQGLFQIGRSAIDMSKNAYNFRRSSAYGSVNAYVTEDRDGDSTLRFIGAANIDPQSEEGMGAVRKDKHNRMCSEINARALAMSEEYNEPAFVALHRLRSKDKGKAVAEKKLPCWVCNPLALNSKFIENNGKLILPFDDLGELEACGSFIRPNKAGVVDDVPVIEVTGTYKDPKSGEDKIQTLYFKIFDARYIPYLKVEEGPRDTRIFNRDEILRPAG